MNFNFGRAIGFGILLWIIVFALSALAMAVGWTGFAVVGFIIAVIAGILAFVFAGYVHEDNALMAFYTSLTFVVITAVLDLVITMRFSSTIFSQWTLWLGYALIFIAPFMQVGNAMNPNMRMQHKV